jgi:S-(hydroxymethyl)glutathione dehydrogenase/alcohol dehydrogenase
MKAAVLHEIGQPLRVEDVELDSPGEFEVHIRVGAAGICRSDLHYIQGDQRVPLPIVLGHEGSGTVLDVGEKVTRVVPGDRVILSFVPNCGRCRFCLVGKPNLCDEHGATGTAMFDGTTRLHKEGTRIAHMGKVACFAEEAVVPESGCIPVTKDLPLSHAALIGCSVTTGVGAALYTAAVEPGSDVVVVGAGGVGLNVIQGCRLAGASKIIVIDIQEGKLEFATKFGATHTINPSVQDPVERVFQLTKGRGANYAFEVFGSSQTVELAYSVTGKGGTLVVVGLAPIGDAAAISPVDLVRHEKTIKGCYYGSSRAHLDMLTMVELYQSGRINIDDLVAREYHLEDINTALADLANGEIGRGVITQF